MTMPNSIPAYTQGLGTAYTGSTFVTNVNPSTSSVIGPNGSFKIGQLWINSANNSCWILSSLTASVGTVLANWEEVSQSSSSEVLSLTGTPNQIVALPPTGDVTVSLADGISIGSYQTTPPPVGGLLVPGKSAFGTTTPDPRAFFTLNAIAGQFPWTSNSTGTINSVAGDNNILIIFDNTIVAPTVGANACVCFDSNTRFFIPVGQTINLGACFYGNPFVTANAGTITTLGTFIAPPYAGAAGGTLTNAYGAIFNNPGTGTNRTALYADDISSGVLASGIPTSGTFRSAPPDSNTATTAFGAITFSTPIQNTLGYDAIVSGSLSVSSAAGAAIVMGVGPTATPTPTPITPSLTVAAITIIGFSAYVPVGYYLNLSGLGGALTVDSVTTTVTPV